MKCTICGIGVRQLIAQTRVWGHPVYIHTEPRSLLNNMHNGTHDHNAVVAQVDLDVAADNERDQSGWVYAGPI